MNKGAKSHKKLVDLCNVMACRRDWEAHQIFICYYSPVILIRAREISIAHMIAPLPRCI